MVILGNFSKLGYKSLKRFLKISERENFWTFFHINNINPYIFL
jgi:hypothetical protein